MVLDMVRKIWQFMKHTVLPAWAVSYTLMSWGSMVCFIFQQIVQEVEIALWVAVEQAYSLMRILPPSSLYVGLTQVHRVIDLLDAQFSILSAQAFLTLIS